jgi:hypothetical protein
VEELGLPVLTWSVVIVCGQPKRNVQPENRAHDFLCGDGWEKIVFRPAIEAVHCSVWLCGEKLFFAGKFGKLGPSLLE